LNTSTLLNRWLGDYIFSVDADGYGHISGLSSTHRYEITYSTDTEYADWGPFTLSEQWIGTTTLGNFDASDSVLFEDMLGATHEITLYEADFNIQNLTTLQVGNNFTINGTENFYMDDFKVFKEGHTEIDCFDMYLPWHHYDAINLFSINFTYLNIDWDIDPPAGLDLHMDVLSFDVEYTIFVIYNGSIVNGTVPTWNVTATFDIVPASEMIETPIYAEHIPGRYEWGIVGTNAASVDSAGLSLVSAAFKNKQVEYGLAGEDMYDAEVANQMPWVMNKVGTGTTWADYYYYNYGTGYANDYRTALRSNWCTTWPVTSSNMIAVGGPLANMLSYYENDFSEAFYGLSQFTADPIWKDHIVSRTCWLPHDAAHAYTSSNSTGYGVITAYLDLNGTVVLQLWGVWGRDTYYLTKWFHEYGIFQLQEAPYGLTSIVVKIPYTSYPEGYKPGTVSIKECLGTVSEMLWIHHGEDKGGIHDP